MENQNSSYSVQIGKTTFIVCVKQSEPQEHQSNPCSVWLMWQEFLD